MNYNLKDFLEIESIKNPSFNFDGKKIAFLSNLSGSYQIYLISSRIGRKPKQITFFKDQIYFISFSPVEDKIVFGKSDKENEQVQLYLYSLKTKKIKNLSSDKKITYRFGSWSPDGRYITYSKNKRNKKDFDVYLMNIKSGKEKCIYSKGGNCYPTSFSPRQNFITIQKKHSNIHTDILLYSLKDESVKKITNKEAYYGSISWLPDDSCFYCMTDYKKNFLGVSSYNLSSDNWEYISSSKNDIESVKISCNGKYLVTTANKKGYKKISLYNLSDMRDITPRKIKNIENIYQSVFSKNSNYLLMLIGDSLNTGNLWIYSLKTKKINQLTHSYQKVSSKNLVKPKLFYFKSFDSLKIPCFLYLPKKIKSNKKIPVVINIHGGPEAQHRPFFSPFIQYFTYKGYAVAVPNIRGSSGYGKKYLSLDDVEKRFDAIKDVSYLHKYIKLNNKLDHNKVILFGGSYGGYMVLINLAFYPHLWLGGVSIVGISNFITFLKNTAPHRLKIREAEYGSLKKDRELLKKLSPINYVKNIKKPLLMIHGANDPRVPISEANQIMKKLLKQRNEVDLIVYKNEGHGLSKLKNRIDSYSKIFNFIERINKDT